MKYRRIVFGEPAPGGAPFANILKRLDESVAYCNRTGTLGHDRVTDFPASVPKFGLDFAHPTPLQFIEGQPDEGDPYGLLRWHRMRYYHAGAAAVEIPQTHKLAASLANSIYGGTSTLWAVPLTTTADVAWAIFTDTYMGVRRHYVVFRGTDFGAGIMDFVRDIGGFDLSRLFARLLHHDILGPMWDGFVIGMEPAWAAIQTALKQLGEADEIVLTGHSLGAARAGVAAAYAVMGR